MPFPSSILLVVASPFFLDEIISSSRLSFLGKSNNAAAAVTHFMVPSFHRSTVLRRRRKGSFSLSYPFVFPGERRKKRRLVVVDTICRAIIM